MITRKLLTEVLEKKLFPLDIDQYIVILLIGIALEILDSLFIFSIIHSARHLLTLRARF